MATLQYRQQKIQEKRKQTPWREFVMEICSWYPMNLYKNNGLLTRYPNSNREGNIVSNKGYDDSKYYIVHEPQNKDFFSQIQEVFLKTEKKCLPDWYNNENTDFVDCAFGLKNGYLSFGVGLNAENVFYTAASYNTITNIYNSVGINSYCDNIYYCKLISKSYNIYYSQNIHDSNNIWYCTNMLGCHECLGCEGLQHQSYCIDNIKYEKTTYLEMKNEFIEQYRKRNEIGKQMSRV